MRNIHIRGDYFADAVRPLCRLCFRLGDELAIKRGEKAMLVLTRKTEQKIFIGPDVVVTVVAVKGNRVRIGIEAPKHVRVLRGEVPAWGPQPHESTAPTPIAEPDFTNDRVSSSAALSAL
jgi:carbon storage regulator